MKARLYVRVSTHEQAKEGFSIPAQINSLRLFCRSQGWEIVGEYVEQGRSAKNTDRPELQRLLADAASHTDVVLVWRLDRLTRSVPDLYRLVEYLDGHGVGLKSATEVFDTNDSMGRFVIGLLALLAQLERERLADRVREGLAEKVRQGQRLGAVPYGYAITEDDTLVVDPETSEIVKEVYARYRRGEGIISIAKDLNRRKVPTSQGASRWHRTSLHYMLRNPVYIGAHEYHGEIVAEGTHESIIPIAQWRQTQQLLIKRAQTHARVGQYPLSGVLKCAKCGGPMTGKRQVSRGKEYLYYVCRAAHDGACDMRYLPKLKVEASVLKLAARPEPAIRRAIKATNRREEEREVRRIKALLQDIRRQKDKLYALLMDDVLPKQELYDRLQPLLDQESALSTDLSSRVRAGSPEIAAGDLEDALQSLRREWEHLTDDERKSLVHALFDKLVVDESGSIRPVFSLSPVSS